jgi:hypothetical protein
MAATQARTRPEREDEVRISGSVRLDETPEGSR